MQSESATNSGLGNVKGYLIDLDGTIYLGDQLIPGAKAFVHELRERGVPHAFVTNITSRPRSQVLQRIRDMGLEISANHVLTAPIATKVWLDHSGVGPCFFLTRPRLIEDFAGHPQSEDRAEAVVVGDMGNLTTFEHLNQAFRLIQNGAKFVTMSQSRYFRDAQGLCLDAGSFVALLEHATQRKAVVTGKPSAEFFRSGLELLDLPANEVAMIGDDLESDVGGAQKCGLKGILVLTGKTPFPPPTDSHVQPDLVIESVAELIQLL
jgi:HAD superfamily hydrolase (TIGR01458 family)